MYFYFFFLTLWHTALLLCVFSTFSNHDASFHCMFYIVCLCHVFTHHTVHVLPCNLYTYHIRKVLVSVTSVPESVWDSMSQRTPQSTNMADWFVCFLGFATFLPICWLPHSVPVLDYVYSSCFGFVYLTFKKVFHCSGINLGHRTVSYLYLFFFCIILIIMILQYFHFPWGTINLHLISSHLISQLPCIWSRALIYFQCLHLESW